MRPCHLGPCPDCPNRPDGRMLMPCLRRIAARERIAKRRLKERQIMANAQLCRNAAQAVEAWLGSSPDIPLHDWLAIRPSPADVLAVCARRVAERFTPDDVELDSGLQAPIAGLKHAIDEFDERKDK